MAEMVRSLQRRHVNFEELFDFISSFLFVFFMELNKPPNAESVSGDDDEFSKGATNADDGVRPDGELGHHVDLIRVTLKLLLDGVERPDDANTTQGFFRSASGGGVKRLPLLPQFGAQFVDDEKADEIPRQQDAVQRQSHFPSGVDAETDTTQRQRPLENCHADHAPQAVRHLNHGAGDVIHQSCRVLRVVPVDAESGPGIISNGKLRSRIRKY